MALKREISCGLGRVRVHWKSSGKTMDFQKTSTQRVIKKYNMPQEWSLFRMHRSGLKCHGDELQKDLAGLHEWAARWRMSISTNKCYVPREKQSKPYLRAAVLKTVS